MKSENFFGELDAANRKNKILQIVLGVCVLIILIQSLTISKQTGRDRVAFVPPEITRPFWISGEDASSEYFEQLGQFIGSLPLNVTQDTVAQACGQFLTYVLPRDRPKFKKRCTIEEARIRRDNISQLFSIREVKSDARNKRVALIGTLSTFIGEKRVSFEETAYLVEFAHSDGRFYVINNEKVNKDEPFNTETK